MKKHYTLGESEFELISINLGGVLEEFDQLWTQYEDKYVHELMVIECQSRRFIAEGISAEATLAGLEASSRQTGDFTEDPTTRQQLNQAHLSFTKILAKINSVANFEGHGRDDLSVDILHAANDVLLKITACESQNLRRLAHKIIASYQNLRDLLRRFRDNIEVVDPQLRNNPDLVEALLEYEKNWEKGKVYLLNSKRCDQLIFFTNVIEGLCEKYPSFKDCLECCDSEVFVQIPMVMLLKRADKEDSDICEVFLPQIGEGESSAFQMFGQLKADIMRLNDRFVALKERVGNVRRSGAHHGHIGARGSLGATPQGGVPKGENKDPTLSEGLPFCGQDRPEGGYKTLLRANKGPHEPIRTSHKKMGFEFYNFLEKKLLTEAGGGVRESQLFGEADAELLEKTILNLRHLSIEMQRFNPMEWNAFLDIAISK